MAKIEQEQPMIANRRIRVAHHEPEKEREDKTHLTKLPKETLRRVRGITIEPVDPHSSLPSAVPDYFPNYTGPGISDGKFQPSVAFGEAPPKNELDATSRLHDTCYATYPDDDHREACDELYCDDTALMTGVMPGLACDAVTMYNGLGRHYNRLNEAVVQYGPWGLAKYGYQNIKKSWNKVRGKHLQSEKEEVKRLFDSDPKKGQSGQRNAGKSKSNIAPLIKSNKVEPKQRSPEEVNMLVSKQAARFKNYAALQRAAERSLEMPSSELRGFKAVPTFYKEAYKKRYSRVRKSLIRKNKKRSS